MFREGSFPIANLMKARLVSTRGPGREAVLEIAGARYAVRDGFSWSAEHAPAIDEVFEVELTTTLDEDESWDEKFSSNPQREIGLQATGGWSYLAKGRISSIDPVCVDCGILVESHAIHSHDPSVIGEYVALRIVCLDASGCKIRQCVNAPD
jgi:hypothetical protein